jgi:plastocyanin
MFADAAGNLYGGLSDGGGNGSIFEASGTGFVPASDSGPAIIAQPSGETNVATHAVSFTAAAGGYPDPTIQWQESTDGGKTFADVTSNASATTQTLTVTDLPPSQNGTKYRAVFTNSLGTTASDVVKLSVVPLAIVSPSHASPSYVTGTSTALSALGDASSGEAGLIYTWSNIRAPAGAASPSFSANKSNAARHTVVTFHRDGRYRFRCTISDGDGHTVSTDVQVEVGQNETSLRLMPHHATVRIGQAITFTAAQYDQFGHPMGGREDFNFSVLSGPGKIGASGIFSSASPGAVLIEAGDGELSGTVGVQVIP